MSIKTIGLSLIALALAGCTHDIALRPSPSPDQLSTAEARQAVTAVDLQGAVAECKALNAAVPRPVKKLNDDYRVLTARYDAALRQAAKGRRLSNDCFDELVTEYAAGLRH